MENPEPRTANERYPPNEKKFLELVNFFFARSNVYCVTGRSPPSSGSLCDLSEQTHPPCP
jgi:hypothetical protein